MSKLDDLQSTAQQVSNDADSQLGGLGQLQSENDTAVQEAVAWGNEAGAQILDGPGKMALDEATQHLQGFQEKLKEYIDTVEQAKSGG
ncbi:MAG: hypothetical protein GEV09_27425 [Pseudonocardiaceae bacterium]|nr:hypothetical protein [Pseudonocardiaceae bacterium]